MNDRVTLPRPDYPVAMVTGGNRGIGLGITRELMSSGYAVSILATRPEPSDVLEELSSQPHTSGRVSYTQGSVADLDDCKRYIHETLEKWGRIDALVNNAGIAPPVRADLLEATQESFDKVMSVNLRGPYFLTQQVALAMIEQRDRDLAGAGMPRNEGEPVPWSQYPYGTIINVSSISASTVSTNRGEYCVSKAGVHMATLLYATRLAPEGIVVYEVQPGVIKTDMTAGVQEKYDSLFAAGIAPMPRWGTAQDVGSTVAMLVAGHTPYSTGDVIHVDGGMHIPTL